MTPAPRLAKRWTCDGCGVTVSHADGAPMPLPGAWASSAAGLFCLLCRRERAAEAALGSVSDDSPLDTRARLRRTALIEFEVSRTPDQSDGTIARKCRTSVTVVAQARRRLRLPDPPAIAGVSRTAHRATAGQ